MTGIRTGAAVKVIQGSALMTVCDLARCQRGGHRLHVSGAAEVWVKVSGLQQSLTRLPNTRKQFVAENVLQSQGGASARSLALHAPAVREVARRRMFTPQAGSSMMLPKPLSCHKRKRMSSIPIRSLSPILLPFCIDGADTERWAAHHLCLAERAATAARSPTQAALPASLSSRSRPQAARPRPAPAAPGTPARTIADQQGRLHGMDPVSSGPCW